MRRSGKRSHSRGWGTLLHEMDALRTSPRSFATIKFRFGTKEDTSLAPNVKIGVKEQRRGRKRRAKCADGQSGKAKDIVQLHR